MSALVEGEHEIGTVQSLFEHDWIMPGQRLLERLTSAGAQPDVAITCVAIVTKNRLPLLRRCLVGILNNRRAWGRTYRLAVFDDSVDTHHRTATHGMIAQLAREYGAPIIYVDIEAKRRFIDAVASRVGIDRHVVEFGFLGGADREPTYGANVNSFLMHVGGELALCLDDDVVCRVASAPGARLDTLHFSQESDPTEFRFYPTRQAALEAAGDEGIDIARVHETALGKDLGSLATGYEKDRVSATLSARLTRSLMLGKGTVATTWMGLAGDNAMGCPHDLLLLDDACLDGLAATMRSDQHNITRDVVRSSRETTVTCGGRFMKTVFGADRRTLLPPFMPRFRNSDGLFSVCAPLCLPHGYFAHLPFVIAHDPSEERRWVREDLWQRAGTIRINDLLCGALYDALPLLGHTDDVAQRTVSLGRYCEMLGKQPYPVFRDFMRSQFVRVQHERLARLVERLDTRRPSRWTGAIHRQIKRIEGALNEDSFAPSDIQPRSSSSDEPLQRVHRLVREFGHLLAAWPEINKEGAATASISRTA